MLGDAPQTKIWGVGFGLRVFDASRVSALGVEGCAVLGLRLKGFVSRVGGT